MLLGCFGIAWLILVSLIAWLVLTWSGLIDCFFGFGFCSVLLGLVCQCNLALHFVLFGFCFSAFFFVRFRWLVSLAGSCPFEVAWFDRVEFEIFFRLILFILIERSLLDHSVGRMPQVGQPQVSDGPGLQNPSSQL